MNRLRHSQSPYLLAHKDNPVDWYEWGGDAFAAARELDRPILLSIGYLSAATGATGFLQGRRPRNHCSEAYLRLTQRGNVHPVRHRPTVRLSGRGARLSAGLARQPAGTCKGPTPIADPALRLVRTRSEALSFSGLGGDHLDKDRRTTWTPATSPLPTTSVS